ncbi:ABC transporter ATP-binding protein [[Clostridium] dakarense]|uniref:ABC transporter ATP-binding protein n=1 Tax=Faecalimicrobium dakarense TaxID=1301100 RepID=UPI0004BAF4A6|nr:ABC transporter ATP-binding protein [[Clostridium] dakarense]
MKILELKNLEKSYNENTVVNKINLSIDKGVIYGLLGPNGAGKSTTINMITGLITPNDGEIIYEENEAKISKWKRNIGLVPQDFALYWDLTAEENVKFFCSLYGFKGNDLKERVNKALEFVGLVDVRKKRASTFSGGMKRRLNIACAIAHSPKLIIMDEPTVGIDPQSRNHILESVKKLKESNATVIYTSHYMEEIEEICDTIAIIDHGNVIAMGSSDELKKAHASKDIYTIELNEDASKIESIIKDIKGVYKVKSSGNTLKCYYENNKKIIEDLVTSITEEGFIITNIKSEVPSLETVFLELTGKSLRD